MFNFGAHGFNVKSVSPKNVYSLIGFVHKGEWCLSLHLIEVTLESKQLFLSIYLTLLQLLVINLPIR